MPAESPAAASASVPDSTAAPPRQLPTACAPSDGTAVCLLPDDFVDRLCRHRFVDATLALFQKSAPWTHAYLRAKVDAWYTGGPSARTTLLFDEEVLVLRFHAPGKGAMVVEGAGGTYDVLRWDGGCYTLDHDEITTTRPPVARAASMRWDRIGQPMQAAILKSDDVRRVYERRSKACKSATPPEDRVPACENAERALSMAVTDHVRAVGDLPAPELVP